jgi:hypothetical protein
MKTISKTTFLRIPGLIHSPVNQFRQNRNDISCAFQAAYYYAKKHRVSAYVFPPKKAGGYFVIQKTRDLAETHFKRLAEYFKLGKQDSITYYKVNSIGIVHECAAVKIFRDKKNLSENGNNS